MRTHTLAERNRMKAAVVSYHARLQVMNASGTWKDIHNLNGKNFFNGGSLNGNIDNPVVSATFSLRKAIGTDSLSPLMEASGLNRLDDGVTYAPLLNSGRRIRFYAAITDPNVAPISGDWHMLFDGKIDRVDWAPRREVTLTCRDRGAYLLDNVITKTRRYSNNSPGMLVEDVIAQILEDNEADDTLVVPDPPDPAWAVKVFDQDINVSVLAAARALAFQIGWDVRYDWTTGDNFQLLFYEPDRAKTTPDESFGPSEYLDVPIMGFDDEGVRNEWEGWYTDRLTGIRTFQRVEHPGSKLEFRRRPAILSEDATSAIDSSVEMLRMLNAALADTALPIADKGIRTKLFWPVQLGDLYSFPPNDNHYDSTQKFAVVAWTHEFTTTGKRRVPNAYTTLTLRGQPAGGYRTWLEKVGPPGNSLPDVPAPVIDFVLGEADSYGADKDDDASGYDGGIWVGGRFNAGCVAIAGYCELADGEGFSVDRTATTQSIPAFRRPAGTEGLDPNFQFLIRFSTRANYWKRIVLVGVSADGRLSAEVIWPNAVQAVDPIPAPQDGKIDGVTVTPDVTRTSYLVAVTPLSVDTNYTDNWLCVARDGQVVFKKNIGTDLSVVNFLDTGLDASTHQWDAFIWNNGVSGPKNRWVEQQPVPADIQFTIPPKGRLAAGDVPEVYMEGTTAVVGADRMAIVKSLDQRSTTTIGISAGLTPFQGVDSDVTPKWYKLIAFSSTDPDIWAETEWRWWAGIPPTESQGNNPPQFANGTPKKVQSGGENGTAVLTVLAIDWLCATSGAAQISIQSSPDNGITPWTEVYRDAAVASGYYRNFGLRNTNRWYRLVALDAAGSAMAASAGVHYVP